MLVAPVLSALNIERLQRQLARYRPSRMTGAVFIGAGQGQELKVKFMTKANITDSIQGTGDKQTEMMSMKRLVDGEVVAEFKLKDCIVEYRPDAKYFVEYITMGIPVDVYDSIARQLTTHNRHHQLDKVDRVIKRGDHYFTSVNPRGKNTSIVRFIPRVDESEEPPTAYEIGTLENTIGGLKSSVIVAMVAILRLKRQADSSALMETPWTIGMTLKSIILTGLCDVVDKSTDIEEDVMAQLMASVKLTQKVNTMSTGRDDTPPEEEAAEEDESNAEHSGVAEDEVHSETE
jgi:hypothetical protein